MKLASFINIKLSAEDYKSLFKLLDRLSKIATITKDSQLKDEVLDIMRAIVKRQSKEYIKRDESK